MNKVIEVKKTQVAPIVKAAFPSYRGRKFKIEFTDRVAFVSTNWHGGTRNSYVAVKANGDSRALRVPAPWDNMVEGKSFDLPPDLLIVKHCIFCGKDLGLTIYAHPTYLPQWLPDGGEETDRLTDLEAAVLHMFVGLNSSGRKWVMENYRPDRHAFETAKLKLEGLGLVKINRAGAVSATVEGRSLYRKLQDEKGIGYGDSYWYNHR